MAEKKNSIFPYNLQQYYFFASKSSVWFESCYIAELYKTITGLHRDELLFKLAFFREYWLLSLATYSTVNIFAHPIFRIFRDVNKNA